VVEIDVQKQKIEQFSGMKGALVLRNSELLEEKGLTQKIIMKGGMTFVTIPATLQMIYGGVDSFLKDKYRTIESAKKRIILENSCSQTGSKRV
jgi:hypothetical protein